MADEVKTKPKAGDNVILAFSQVEKVGSLNIKKLYYSNLRGVQNIIDVDEKGDKLFEWMIQSKTHFFFIDAKEEIKRFFKTFKSLYPMPKAMDFNLISKVLSGGLPIPEDDQAILNHLNANFYSNKASKEQIAEMLSDMLDLYKRVKDPAKKFKTTITIEQKAIQAFAEMEYFGINVDFDNFSGARKLYSGYLANSQGHLAGLLGAACPRNQYGEPEANWRSSKELLDVLQKANVKIKDSDGKLRLINSTKKEEVQRIHNNNEIRDAIRDYKSAADNLSKCDTDLLKAAGVSKKSIKPKINQISAPTGRNSISEPSFSSLPTKLRRLLKGNKDEVIITADYDQCELRILAHVSRDPLLTHAFSSGVDIHNFSAEKMFNVAVPNDSTNPNYAFREKAKGVNYGISYGQTSQGLADSLGVSIEEATEILNRHKREFKTAHDCLNYLGLQAFRNGVARSLSGRARFFDLPNEKNEMSVRRRGMNMTMQGTSADMIKIALGKLVDLRVSHDCQFKIWNTTYDSISVRATTKNNNHQTVARVLKRAMIEAEKMLIPSVPPAVSIEMGDTWK